MLLPTGVNNRDALKALKMLAVGGITKEHGQPALGSARRRSLRKPQPGCFELAASGIQEHVERRYRSCRIQKVGVATVPVDLAPTLLERAWIIEVVGSQGSAERIDCALNRRSVWSGCLEYERRGVRHWLVPVQSR